jgi:hypothetical protein
MAIPIHQLRRGLKVQLDTGSLTPIMSVVEFGQKMSESREWRMLVDCEWHDIREGMKRGVYPPESLIIAKQ